MASKEIALGKKLRDKVSGFTGIASVKTEFLTGNVQYELVMQVDKSGKSEFRSFDEFQLEYVGEGIDAIKAPGDTGIRLGEKVKDIVTGGTGIATLKSTFLNGCVYYSVVTQDQKDPKEYFTEYRRLTRVSAGVMATIAKRMGTDSVRTGGPAFSVPRRS